MTDYRCPIAALVLLQLFLAMSTIGVGATPAPCAELLPEEMRSKLESTYRGWQVLEYGHLDARQQAVWGSRCPGVAVGNFKGTAEIRHAVVVVREIGGTKQAKLLLAEGHSPGFSVQVLREEGEVPSYPVVHREPPGTYHEVYDREHSIAVTSDVFVYEHLEATATLFFYKDGRFQELLISD